MAMAAMTTIIIFLPYVLLLANEDLLATDIDPQLLTLKADPLLEVCWRSLEIKNGFQSACRAAESRQCESDR